MRVAAGRGSTRAHLVLSIFALRKLDLQQHQQVDVVVVVEHVVVHVLLAIIRRADGADGGRVADLPKVAGAATGRGTTGRVS